MTQRLNLTRATHPPRGHLRQLALVQHGGDNLRQLGRDRGMTFDEIGEPGEYETTCHPRRQRLSKCNRRGIAHLARMGDTLFSTEALIRVLTVAGGDTIDDYVIVFVDELEKALSALGDIVDRSRRKLDVLTLPGNTKVTVKVEAGPVFEGNHARKSPVRAEYTLVLKLQSKRAGGAFAILGRASPKTPQDGCMAGLATHVLDTSDGLLAEGFVIDLWSVSLLTEVHTL